MITAPGSFSKPNALYASILFFCALLIYLNTIPNDYALDDYTVIKYNPLIQKGARAVPQILTQQNWYGGRGYRPIPAISFALEQTFAGGKAGWGHFTNAVFFGITVVLLFVLCRRFAICRNEFALSFWVACYSLFIRSTPR